MSDSWDGASVAGTASTSGPSLSYAFNLAKIPDQGEDSDPIVRDGPDLGLIGVFDGMGGAGGTVYETPDGPRTGAYLASRVARDVVERRMLDLLEPDWNLNGQAAAEDLRRSVRRALEDRLTELKAPVSRLRSKLLRALPTTMAVTALQRTQRTASTWAGHVFWSGDSRAYALTVDGMHQLHTDDLRDPGDAMANLHNDSVVSNAMSADTDYHVSYRRVELKAPFLVICATDGCFGYVKTPMHFEHLMLRALADNRTINGWSQAVQAEITAVTGDDAAMAVMGVGADLAEFQTVLKPRLDTLERDFITPLDQLRLAVEEAERTLEQARRSERDEKAGLWSAYQHGYERLLRDAPEDPAPEHNAPEDAAPGDVAAQDDAAQDGPAEEDAPATSLRTPVDGEADGVEERPTPEETRASDVPADGPMEVRS